MCRREAPDRYHQRNGRQRCDHSTPCRCCRVGSPEYEHTRYVVNPSFAIRFLTEFCECKLLKPSCWTTALVPESTTPSRTSPPPGWTWTTARPTYFYIFRASNRPSRVCAAPLSVFLTYSFFFLLSLQISNRERMMRGLQ